MKMLLSLAVWFVLWEAIGQAKLSSIVPPFSAVIEAAIEIGRASCRERVFEAV